MVTRDEKIVDRFDRLVSLRDAQIEQERRHAPRTGDSCHMPRICIGSGSGAAFFCRSVNTGYRGLSSVSVIANALPLRSLRLR